MNDPRTEEACASCYKGRPTNPERAQFASNVRNRLILARCAPPHIYAIRKTNREREWQWRWAILKRRCGSRRRVTRTRCFSRELGQKSLTVGI